jgi:amylovoran biosynthesis glycosyltransferase AmsE
MNISILISVYHGTEPQDLDRCLNSLVDQNLKSTQIVLVQDGPVRPAVIKCIERYAFDLPFEHLVYSENRGLGLALHDGLAACTHEIVARVDSDDCCMLKRFALQGVFMEENSHISVVGGWMLEHYPKGTGFSTNLRCS